MAIKISDNLLVNANKPADAKYGPYAQVGTAPIPAVIISTTATAATTTSVVTVASATGIVAGQTVAGTGVGASVTVASVSGTNVTLSAAVTVSSGAALTFTTPAVAASTNPAYKSAQTVACDAILQVYRHKGLTVGLLQTDGSIKEYWWKEGTNNDQLVAKGGMGGETTVEIVATVSAGAIGAGVPVPAGTDLEEFIKQLLQQEVPPVFVHPSATIALTLTPAPSVTPNASSRLYEMGTRVTDVSALVTYRAGDGGNPSSISVQRNDVQYDNKLNALSVAVTANSTGEMFDATIVPSGGAATKNSNAPFNKPYNNPYVAGSDLLLPVNTNQITIQGIYPWFYGTHSGTAGSDAFPTLTSGNIYAGTGGGGQTGITINSTKVVAPVTAELSVADFGSATSAFLWFAVPSGSKTFTKWRRGDVGAIDQGNIGTTGAFTDLFRAATQVSVTSTTRAATGGSSGTPGTEWTQVYDVYVTNTRTESVGGANNKTTYFN